MADTQRVTVTIADAGLARVDEVVAHLRAEGMDVEQVLGSLGIVVGSVPAGRRAAIAALPDIAAVEAETTFQVPPLDGDPL